MAATNIQVFQGDVEISSNLAVTDVNLSSVGALKKNGKNLTSWFDISDSFGVHQTSKLVPPGPGVSTGTGEWFGKAIALDHTTGNFLAIGMPADDTTTSLIEVGQVHMYARNTPGDSQSSWTHYQTISPPGSPNAPHARMYFGDQVCLDGDTLIISAYQHIISPNSDDTGSVFIYKRSNPSVATSVFVLVQEIQPPNFSSVGSSQQIRFGLHVSLSVDTCIISCQDRISGYPSSYNDLAAGAVEIYTRDTPGDSTSTWSHFQTLQQHLSYTAGSGRRYFGRFTCIKGNTIAIGTSGEEAVHIYTRANSTLSTSFSLADTLYPDDPPDQFNIDTKTTVGSVGEHQFGSSIDIHKDGDEIVVRSAKWAPTGSLLNTDRTGKFYIFSRDTPGSLTSSYTQQFSQPGFTDRDGAYSFMANTTGSQTPMAHAWGKNITINDDYLLIGMEDLSFGGGSMLMKRDTPGSLTSSWSRVGASSFDYFGSAEPFYIRNQIIQEDGEPFDPYGELGFSVEFYKHGDNDFTIINGGYKTSNSTAQIGTGEVSGAVTVYHNNQTTDVLANSIAGDTSNSHVRFVANEFVGDGSKMSGVVRNQAYVAAGTGAGGAMRAVDQSSSKAVAIGYYASQQNKGWAVSIGSLAGYSNGSTTGVLLGYKAGYQHSFGGLNVAIGYEAGYTCMGQTCVSIGQRAGAIDQGSNSVAIGRTAGETSQGQGGGSQWGGSCVAIGALAGMTSQGDQSIAIGFRAGESNQPDFTTRWAHASVRDANGNEYLHITNSGEIVRGNGYSDDRLKYDEKFITGAIKSLFKLRPQEYLKKPKLTPDENHDEEWVYESGLMAQEVYYSAPEMRHLVTVSDTAGDIDSLTPAPSDDPSQDPDYSVWGDKPSGIKYIQFIPYLIKGIQEIVTELPLSKTTVSNTWDQNITGLVVSADTNTSKTNTIPIVTLSNVYMDKKWYGVVSSEKTDTNDYDTLINTNGDALIWVTDVSGSLISGDLVTTSNVASGLTQKQDDDIIRSYTVAKVTQDCDFTESPRVPIKIPKRELQSVKYYVKTITREIGMEEYIQYNAKHTSREEKPMYIYEVEGDETVPTNAIRYYKDGEEVSSKTKDAIPKYFNEKTPDEWEKLDGEEKNKYTLGVRYDYKHHSTTRSKRSIPEHEGEVFIDEMVDVIDENGQVVWEDTSETKPLYTLVDHTTYKAALVSCKII